MRTEGTVKEYNAIIELDTTDPEAVDLEALAAHHGTLTESGWRTIEAIITTPADSLLQATATALAVVAVASRAAVRSVQVMSTEDFDRRWPLTPLPSWDTVSVKEAANLLGVSQQAVRQRLDRGTLPGERLGRDWRIPRDAVTA
jgi:excisionase family DNA binding protein